MATLSSLELMLQKIQGLDDHVEDDRNNPPMLPTRPVSKARLPPSRRSILPFHFQELDCGNKEEVVKARVVFDRKPTKREVAVSESEDLLFRTISVPESKNQWGCRDNGCSVLSKIGIMNDHPEERAVQGIIEIQRCFRGHQARFHYHMLKGVIITLQSFVRGENARKKYRLSVKRLKAVVLIQKHLKQKIEIKTLENEDHVVVSYSSIVEVNRRILRAEAALRNKKEENAALRLQIQQFDKKWEIYETNMSSMEKMWQDQLTSIQASLAAVRDRRRSKVEITDLPLNAVPLLGNGRVNTIKHFIEQHENDDSSFFFGVVECREVDSRRNLEGELRKMKVRFEAWKKEFKVRLREMKATFDKLDQVKKIHRRWWQR